MWVMIVMGSYFGGLYSQGTSAITPSMTTAEFSSRERCIEAAKFTKKQKYVYNAFCVQK